MANIHNSRIFISHRCVADDDRKAHQLQEYFESLGATVLLDHFTGGDQTCRRLQSDIKESTHLVLLATRHSIIPGFSLKQIALNSAPQAARWVAIEYMCAEYCANRGGLVLICSKEGDVVLPGFLDQFISIPLKLRLVAGEEVVDRSTEEALLQAIAAKQPVRSLSIGPEAAPAIVALGRELEREAATSGDERKLHEAIKRYDEAIALDFCNHHAWLNKGWSLWKLGSDTVAWTAVGTAKLLRPDSCRVQDIIARMVGGHRSLR